MTEKKWRHDDPIPGTSCPDCGREITYNGNYFCTAWVYPFLNKPGACGWAMSSDPIPNNEKHLFNVAYTSLMKLRGEEPKASALELKKDGTPW